MTHINDENDSGQSNINPVNTVESQFSSSNVDGSISKLSEPQFIVPKPVQRNILPRRSTPTTTPIPRQPLLAQQGLTRNLSSSSAASGKTARNAVPSPLLSQLDTSATSQQYSNGTRSETHTPSSAVSTTSVDSDSSTSTHIANLTINTDAESIDTEQGSTENYISYKTLSSGKLINKKKPLWSDYNMSDKKTRSKLNSNIRRAADNVISAENMPITSDSKLITPEHVLLDNAANLMNDFRGTCPAFEFKSQDDVHTTQKHLQDKIKKRIENKSTLIRRAALGCETPAMFYKSVIKFYSKNERKFKDDDPVYSTHGIFKGGLAIVYSHDDGQNRHFPMFGVLVIAVEGDQYQLGSHNVVPEGHAVVELLNCFIFGLESKRYRHCQDVLREGCQGKCMQKLENGAVLPLTKGFKHTDCVGLDDETNNNNNNKKQSVKLLVYIKMLKVFEKPLTEGTAAAREAYAARIIEDETTGEFKVNSDPTGDGNSPATLEDKVQSLTDELVRLKQQLEAQKKTVVTHDDYSRDSRQTRNQLVELQRKTTLQSQQMQSHKQLAENAKQQQERPGNAGSFSLSNEQPQDKNEMYEIADNPSNEIISDAVYISNAKAAPGQTTLSPPTSSQSYLAKQQRSASHKRHASKTSDQLRQRVQDETHDHTTADDIQQTIDDDDSEPEISEKESTSESSFEEKEEESPKPRRELTTKDEIAQRTTRSKTKIKQTKANK